jgi:hypothetical protein
MEQPYLNQFITEFYARIEYERGNIDYATMVKLVNTTDLKSVGNCLPGSSPGGRTNLWDCFDEKM